MDEYYEHACDVEVDEDGREVKKSKKNIGGGYNTNRALVAEAKKEDAVCPGCGAKRCLFIPEYLAYWIARGFAKNRLNPYSSWIAHYVRAKKGIVCDKTWGTLPQVKTETDPAPASASLPASKPVAPPAPAPPAPALAPKPVPKPAPKPVPKPAAQPEPKPIEAELGMGELTELFYKRAGDRCIKLRAELKEVDDEIQNKVLDLERLDKKRKQLTDDIEVHKAKRQKAYQAVDEIEKSLNTMKKSVETLEKL